MFSGAGAKAYGGRFNSPGRRVVYTSGSLSLGILELIVQSNKRDRLRDLVCASASFDPALVKRLDAADLPANWASRPPSALTQRLGDDWLASRETCILRVPSVVVPRESNYLFNPSHPDVARVTFGEVLPIDLDHRLKPGAWA